MEASSLFEVKGGEHLLLNSGNGRGGAGEALRTVAGEAEVLVAAAAVASDEVHGSERGEQPVHRLAGYERTPGELGVGEPGLVGELFQARVLRDGQVVRAQGRVHRGSQGDRGALEHVADGGVQIDLTHVNMLTYARRQYVDKLEECF